METNNSREKRSEKCETCAFFNEEYVSVMCSECKHSSQFKSCTMPDNYRPSLLKTTKNEQSICEVCADVSEQRYNIHKNLCNGLNELYIKKNHDYGNSFGDGFKEYGIVMTVIRLEDKFRRFKQLSLHPNEQMVNDEGIRDTLRDLANYALMTLTEMEMQDAKQA